MTPLFKFCGVVVAVTSLWWLGLVLLGLIGRLIYLGLATGWGLI